MNTDWEAICRKAGEKIDLLEAEVRRLQAERRWIPCSERLPEDGRSVLASRCNGSGEIMHWCLQGYHPGFGPRFIADRFNYAAGNEYGEVTHWMPLPEGPG